MIKRSILGLFALLTLSASNNPVAGQCKGFARSNCIPELNPFTHNGQLNTALLLAGEKAELVVTFFQGQEYRVKVCSQSLLGDITFRLLDRNRQEVFNSRDHGSPDFWDFTAGATQQFIVEVAVPETGNAHGIGDNGCVAVVIGFKERN